MSSLRTRRRAPHACMNCRRRHVRCVWLPPGHGVSACCQRCRDRDLNCIFELGPTSATSRVNRAVLAPLPFRTPSSTTPGIIPFSLSEPDSSPAPIAELGAASRRAGRGLDLMVFLTVMGVVAAFGFAAVTLALTGPGEVSKHPILRTLAITSGGAGTLFSVVSMIAVSLVLKASDSGEGRSIKRAKCILLFAPSVVCDIVSVVCVVVAVQPWLSGTS